MHNLKERMSKDSRKSPGGQPWWQPGLILFSRMSSWIIGPVIVAVFLGKWLDKKYGTTPWLFLATVGLSFILSTVGIVREGIKGMKEAEESTRKKSCDQPTGKKFPSVDDNSTKEKRTDIQK